MQKQRFVSMVLRFQGFSQTRHNKVVYIFWRKLYIRSMFPLHKQKPSCVHRKIWGCWIWKFPLVILAPPRHSEKWLWRLGGLLQSTGECDIGKHWIVVVGGGIHQSWGKGPCIHSKELSNFPNNTFSSSTINFSSIYTSAHGLQGKGCCRCVYNIFPQYFEAMIIF